MPSVTCASGSECATGHCVDGKCCDSACNGPCERCDLDGTEGRCTASANGTDPDHDCRGPGEADGICAGSCDGQRACSYPPNTTTCGEPVCTGEKLTEHLCRLGACTPVDKSCGNYSCAGSICKTSCATLSDCATSAWCNGAACEPKKANGGTCAGVGECVSGNCAGGYCCETSCAGPESCETGRCLCAGATCTTGKLCIYWYLDSDGDQHAAKTSPTRSGCEDVRPAPSNGRDYTTITDDCDDNNANAYPGSTGFFPTPRGNNSFDYNCDDTEQKQYANIGARICKDCGTPNGLGGCLTCPAAFNPGFCGAGACTSDAPDVGFDTDVACGASALLQNCNVVGGCGANSGTKYGGSTTVQGCR